MKQILIALIIILSFESCTKEKPQVIEDCATVIQFISWCDANWKVIETHKTIEWPRVCGDELAMFKSMENRRDSSTCPSNAIVWIEIHPMKKGS